MTDDDKEFDPDELDRRAESYFADWTPEDEIESMLDDDNAARDPKSFGWPKGDPDMLLPTELRAALLALWYDWQEHPKPIQVRWMELESLCVPYGRCLDPKPARTN